MIARASLVAMALVALADQEFLHGGHQGLHGRLNQLELLERWTMQDKIANLLREL